MSIDLFIAGGLPVLLLASSGLGWWIRAMLGEVHRRIEMVDALRTVMSMLVTFAALVLGLLTSSAKSQFDLHRENLSRFGISLIELDQRLREYGPDGGPARSLLRTYTAAALADTWPAEAAPAGTYPRVVHSGPGRLESAALGGMLLDVDRRIASLEPASELQRQLSNVLIARSSSVLEQRWLLVAASQSEVSWPFMAMMIFWFVLVFATFGLSTPANKLIVVVIFVAAVSVSTAVYLIIDFTQPLDGLLHLSSQPLRDALEHMDRPNTLQ